MAPPKKICLNGKTCSVGKVQESLCYGQRVLHRSELDDHCRKKHETSTISCCAELIDKFRNPQIRSDTHKRTETPGTGRREAGGNQEPGTRKEPEGSRKDPEQQSCLPRIPNFSSYIVQSFDA